MLARIRAYFAARRESRLDNARKKVRRTWLFVHAYGPLQAKPDFQQDFPEAMEFLRHALNATFVRVDWENSIIFFDARRKGE